MCFRRSLDEHTVFIKVYGDTVTRLLVIWAQGASKFISDYTDRKLRFCAFQQWLQIENRTIIKESLSILTNPNSIVLLQTVGGALKYNGDKGL